VISSKLQAVFLLESYQIMVIQRFNNITALSLLVTKLFMIKD